MYRKIVNNFLHFIGATSAVIGIGFLLNAISTPGGYSMYNASAVQITQVYSEAMTYAIESCALLLFAILIEINVYFSQPKSDAILKMIADNTQTTNRMLFSRSNKATQQKIDQT